MPDVKVLIAAALVAALGLFLLHGGLTANVNVVEVTARGEVDFAEEHGDRHFEAPDRIPSGWTTLRLHNRAEETHFVFLYRLPEGKTHQDVIEGTGPVYENVMEQLQAGAVDREEALQILFRELPDWASSITPMGGPGLVAPRRTAQATMYLKPGTYVMECYVKTPRGHFHSAHGMSRALTVTERTSGAAAPAADFEITLSNGEIATRGEMTPGKHTIAVRFQEHPEGSLLGNDVHLGRLDDETDVEEVAAWMDWMKVGGLRAPAPAVFLGGVHEMPVGSTAYFTVDLSPGRYAWIGEAPLGRSTWVEFTVE